MERSLQELVWRRAGHRCEYCQVPQERDRLPFEIDHIIAENHDGTTKVSNLCLCCFACNRHKGPNIAGIDPKTGKIVPLFDPRRHKWSRHFRWDGAGAGGTNAAGSCHRPRSEDQSRSSCWVPAGTDRGRRLSPVVMPRLLASRAGPCYVTPSRDARPWGGKRDRRRRGITDIEGGKKKHH